MRTSLFLLQVAIAAALLLSQPHVSLSKDLATIETHSKRYGSHLGISVYDDPLVRGVACYVSEMHVNVAQHGAHQPHSQDVTASCHQVGKLSLSKSTPVKAQVFDQSVAPTFKSVHVIRIVDIERRALVYVTYMEADMAGNSPGQVMVIPLPDEISIPTK